MAHRELIQDKRYEEYRQKVHEQKVTSMRPAIDNKSPPTFSHLDSRRKKYQMQRGINAA